MLLSVFLVSSAPQCESVSTWYSLCSLQDSIFIYFLVPMRKTAYNSYRIIIFFNLKMHKRFLWLVGVRGKKIQLVYGNLVCVSLSPCKYKNSVSIQSVSFNLWSFYSATLTLSCCSINGSINSLLCSPVLPLLSLYLYTAFINNDTCNV